MRTKKLLFVYGSCTLNGLSFPYPRAQGFEDMLEKLKKYMNEIYAILGYHRFEKKVRLSEGIYLYTIANRQMDTKSDDRLSLLFRLINAGVREFNLFFMILYVVIKHRIDIIMTHEALVSSPPAVLVGFILRKPVIVYTRGDICDYEFTVMQIRNSSSLKKARIPINLLTSFLKAVTIFVCRYSSWVRVDSRIKFSRVKTFGARNVSLIPTGIDLTLFKPGTATFDHGNIFAILYAGGLAPEKGIDTLLKSAQEVLASHQAVFFVAGVGDLKRIERIAAELGVKDHFRFLGVLPRWKMPSLINSVDLVVLPSITEGSPKIILEALACNKPVVATRVGDIPYIVEDQWGLLLKSQDSRELARAITYMVRNRRKYSNMNSRCKIREYYSIEHTVEKIMIILRELTCKERHARPIY